MSLELVQNNLDQGFLILSGPVADMLRSVYSEPYFKVWAVIYFIVLTIIHEAYLAHLSATDNIFTISNLYRRVLFIPGVLVSCYFILRFELENNSSDFLISLTTYLFILPLLNYSTVFIIKTPTIHNS